MNKKQSVRINENQLRRIVTESVKKVLNESVDNNLEQYLKRLINAAKMLKKISGKSSTDEPQDTLSSRVWNFVNAFDDLLVEYGLSDYQNSMLHTENMSVNEDLDLTPKGYEMRSDYRKYGKFASDDRKDAKTFVQQGKYYPDWFATETFDDYPEDDLESFNKAELNRTISADKRWNKSADSRPSHRKGSANRELMDMGI